MTRLRIGQLHHRVTLQSASETADGGGGFTATWSDIATVWARIEPLSGKERMTAQQLENPLTHRITIRHRSGVDAKMRIKFGSRIFNIRSVLNPDEGNEVLELMAEEGVGT